MNASRMIRYLIALLMFFVGAVIYLAAAPSTDKSQFMIRILPGIGVIVSTSLGVGLAVRFIQDDLFPPTSKSSPENLLSHFGITGILARRSGMNIFEEVLNLLMEHNSPGEVFVFGTSLSKILPFYKERILSISSKTSTQFKFMMMEPESTFTQSLGDEIGEPQLKAQLQLHKGYLEDLVSEAKGRGAKIEARWYDGAPLNFLVYLNIKKRRVEKLYLVIYLKSQPGDSCPVVVFSPSANTERSIVDALISSYSVKAWEKAPLKPADARASTGATTLPMPKPGDAPVAGE
jgi:hypothetical protein